MNDENKNCIKQHDITHVHVTMNHALYNIQKKGYSTEMLHP